MDQMNDKELRENLERVLLAGVDLGEGQEEFDRSMSELKELAKACEMEPVGMVTQKLEGINKSLYLGSGKVKEVAETAAMLEVDLVIFNDTLTPSQLRNLQDELKMPVIDRTNLILDIFEKRARTREASLQVESARLQYLLPRLVGMHEALTRQGGTSGSMSSRGAGEKKLELDRRRIEHRITELNRELEEVSKERETQRKKRQKSGVPLVALVGYTNAGKSTILNRMIEKYGMDEEKKVLEKDMLFATLDTSVRRICTGNNRDFLLSDTVGFIHKLPHGLVKAFRATSAPPGAGQIPMITVFNKADRADQGVSYPKTVGDKIYMSAKEDSSLEMLTELILHKTYDNFKEMELLIPYEKGQIVSYFMENSHVLSIEYEKEGTRLKVMCHPGDKEKYSCYEK